MKRSLVALAVLGAFAGAASAQSSVTIYGIIDLAVTKGNGGTAYNQGANSTSEAYLLKQSTASRLGFRGNEDLGGGLSAQFDIQHRFTPDDGAANATFWAGRSIVSLTSKTAGRVYLGREYVPAFWVALKSDPFGQNGVGQVGGRAFAGFSVQGLAGAPNIRTANTVGYNTPNLSGFKANVAVGLGENVTGRETGLNVEYENGGLYIGVGYEKITAGAASGAALHANGDGSSLVNVGVNYDFGAIKPILYFARSKTGIGNNSTNKLGEVALLAPIGPGKLKAAYTRFDPQGDNNTETKLGVGYDYSLSKRTIIYLDGSFAKQDLRTNNRVVALGVRHDF